MCPYMRMGSVVIRTLLPFSSTYLCESGFSALVNIKTKSRNKLDCKSDLRCALSATKPRIKILVSKNQLHPYHWWKLIANKILICSRFVHLVLGWGANCVGIVKGGRAAKSLRTPGLGWCLERIVPLTGQNMQWSARPSKRLFRCCCIHFWTLEENCFTADFNQKRQLLYSECGGDNNDARNWPPLLAIWGQSTSIDAIQVLKFQHMRWIPISPDEIHDTFNVDKWNVCKFCLFPLTMVKYLSVCLTLVTRSTSGIQVLWTQKLWYALRRMWWRRRNVR